MANSPGYSGYKVNLFQSWRVVSGIVDWAKVGVRIGYCPVCGCRRPIVKLNDDEIAVRCLYCRASTVTMSMVDVLRRAVPDLRSKSVYELSARGPLFQYLARNAGSLTCSEYFDNVRPGEFLNGIQCQDVQQLTYPDGTFDICTSTEVFEHVPNDLRGFSEMHRVLKPGGVLVFTVPLIKEYDTIERATLQANGKIRHLCPPEYHIDPLRQKPLLAFRDYGTDIVGRLLKCSFADAAIVTPGGAIPWGYRRPVVVAHR